MSHVKIDEEDVVTVICKLICQLCQSIWDEKSHRSVRRSGRKVRPREFYDPTSVDRFWRSTEGTEIHNGSNHTSQHRSQSSTAIDQET